MIPADNELGRFLFHLLCCRGVVVKIHGFITHIHSEFCFQILRQAIHFNVFAARSGEDKDIERQCQKQRRERREIPSALAVEDFDNHRSRAREQVLEGVPNAAVPAQHSDKEVAQNESQGEPTCFGILPAFGTIIAFELGAAVEAMDGFGFGLGLGLCYGLYLVLHDCRALMGAKVGKMQ